MKSKQLERTYNVIITHHEAGEDFTYKYLNVSAKERDALITRANIPHDRMDKWPTIKVTNNG